MATTGTPSATAQVQADVQASSGAPAGSHSFSSLDIKNTNIQTAPGVSLSEQQKVTIGSVLDVSMLAPLTVLPRLAFCNLTHSHLQLFEGHPTLPKFSLWSQNATFTDNITVATGYPKYTAQFYGLPALFKPIQLQHHRVTSAGNPIELEMSNKYVVKGIKKEQVMNSVVRIFVGEDGKISKVEDRWNGKLPEGAISDVSTNASDTPKEGQMSEGRWTLSPFALVHWAVAVGRNVGWWAFCEFSWWSPFLVGGPPWVVANG